MGKKRQIKFHSADIAIMIHKAYGIKYKNIEKVAIRRDRVIVTFDDSEESIHHGIITECLPTEMANLTTEQINKKIKNPCSIFDHTPKDPIAEEYYEEMTKDIIKNIPGGL